MLVRLTYVLVILIWATTPLAIKLGGASFAPMAGLTLRIALAFSIGSVICTVSGYASLNIRKHWPLYLAASISLFPNMALVYMAAQYISSGLIALLFGLSPLFTAAMSRLILGESAMQPRKWLAIVLAAIGLVLIFSEKTNLASGSATGIGLMLLSNVFFSGSALWVKRLNKSLTVPPLEQALGAMAFALPSMLLTWVFGFGVTPIQYTATSLAALLYLALFGSLLGFVAYYYILSRMTVETVSLIPFITPVLAMLLGVFIADELVTPMMMAGAGLILIALGIYQKLWQIFRFSSSQRAHQADAAKLAFNNAVIAPVDEQG